MTDEEIKRGFLSLDPQHTFFKAAVALLENTTAVEQNNVVIPNLTDAARHFNAGRLAAAMDLKDLLQETMQAAYVEEQERILKEQLAAARKQ